MAGGEGLFAIIGPMFSAVSGIMGLFGGGGSNVPPPPAPVPIAPPPEPEDPAIKEKIEAERKRRMTAATANLDNRTRGALGGDTTTINPESTQNVPTLLGGDM